MTIDFAGLVRGAWAMFRRDADLLVRIAGPFFFLPAFALVLLVPASPAPDAAIADREAQAEAWMAALQSWVGDYGLGCAIAYCVSFLGIATTLSLYLDATRPDVGGALRRAGTLMPRFLLAMIAISIPTGLGMYILLIPGLYLMARFLLTGAVLIAERPVGAMAAIARSWRLTRRAQFALLGAVAFVYLAGMLSGQPFLLLGRWLTQNGEVNPVITAITGAFAATIAAAAQLASTLIAITAYRRLAR